MCMFALTVSIVEPKNLKEAMADSAWIEAMQDELHQFDRLKVWDSFDKPFWKMVIKLKWLWQEPKSCSPRSCGFSCLRSKHKFFPIYHMDVENGILNGHEGGGLCCSARRVRCPDHLEQVILLRKALYGFKASSTEPGMNELSNFCCPKALLKLIMPDAFDYSGKALLEGSIPGDKLVC
ncbi:retrovirus-related pol polyprotein from transposon TNT 1-94 [Tanacetum coccineum]|uniref:Retrovirus-related pol polyprotein from transposon TNT 1-94 n=1 Tax=Tanacetum coccineum TaxID=301880 RepID=A0ABQ5DMC9_9ASTR